MPEISTEDLYNAHRRLDSVGVYEIKNITDDVIRLDARIDCACGKINDLTAERDSARAEAERLAVVREAAREDLKAAIAERDAVKARLAALPDVADPRDPPVEGAAEATIKRLWSIIADHMPDIDPATCEYTIETMLKSLICQHEEKLMDTESRLRRARAMLHAAIDREIDGD